MTTLSTRRASTTDAGALRGDNCATHKQPYPFFATSTVAIGRGVSSAPDANWLFNTAVSGNMDFGLTLRKARGRSAVKRLVVKRGAPRPAPAFQRQNTSALAGELKARFIGQRW